MSTQQPEYSQTPSGRTERLRKCLLPSKAITSIFISHIYTNNPWPPSGQLERLRKCLQPSKAFICIFISYPTPQPEYSQTTSGQTERLRKYLQHQRPLTCISTSHIYTNHSKTLGHLVGSLRGLENVSRLKGHYQHFYIPYLHQQPEDPWPPSGQPERLRKCLQPSKASICIII